MSARECAGEVSLIIHLKGGTDVPAKKKVAKKVAKKGKKKVASKKRK
jgi:hypothetical protein